MKSYGQMIYEAYKREHGLVTTWAQLVRKEEWDRIGQDVAMQMHPDDVHVPKEQPEEPSKERTVIVCDKCLRASCWQGAFYCDESHTTAGLVEKTVAELEALGYENSEYWEEGAGVDFPAGQKDTWQRPGAGMALGLHWSNVSVGRTLGKR